MTMVIDDLQLKADGANSASGSFTVSRDWGAGKLNFCAMAGVDKTNDIWNSNVVSF